MVCTMELAPFLLARLAVYSAYNWQPSPLNYVEKENELTNKFELSTESPSRLRVSGTHRFLPVK